VVCRIAPKGAARLKALDPVVNATDQDALESLTDSEVETLIRLMNKIRISQH